MHLADSVVILAVATSVWAALAFVVIEALPLAAGPSLRVALLSSGGAVGAFATAALIAVLVHLGRSRDELYAEDLRHRGEVTPDPEEVPADFPAGRVP